MKAEKYDRINVLKSNNNNIARNNNNNNNNGGRKENGEKLVLCEL